MCALTTEEDGGQARVKEAGAELKLGEYRGGRS